MADQDKYEWESLARHDKLHSCFGKAIFIRDIQQHFYVDGINHVIDSIDRIIEVLQPIVEGYEITTVGTSSGGYLAMLLGSVLNAKRAFSFCGQIDLTIWGGGNNSLSFSDFQSLYSRKDISKYNKWFVLTPFLSGSACKVFHFYAGKNKADVRQALLTANLQNIYRFAMNTEKHGTPVWGGVIPYLVTADDCDLEAFSQTHISCLISKISISLQFTGVLKTLKYILKKMF